MLVSWNWLQDYVSLPMELAELENRLAMSGLNHESTEKRGDDWAIDLEVTSNRPDCLGHLGVAREISVLWDSELKIPDPRPSAAGPPIQQLTKVSITCPDLCFRYTARLIRGVKLGPSPDWLADRLQAIGIAVINNVVDVTNYVMMESGQPLHAFDFRLLKGSEIRVREALKEEEFEAIDHRLYQLEPGMCVIADAARAVALGGVMGGVDSEVTDDTQDVLIEAAEFAPLSIRNTARKLNLQSPSSYRFERGMDPRGIDWASRRCCQLILELAGGELAKGVIDVGRQVEEREPIQLRYPQIPRILGIEVPQDETTRILTAIGNDVLENSPQAITVKPPTWRRDLTREIDLIEEVARIYGYEKIPEDVGVPMAPSHRRDEDLVLERVRQVMVAAGYDEAMSASVVPESWCQVASFWTQQPPLVAATPMLKGADRLRVGLFPSLLESRRVNEAVSNPTVELFETARVYLPTAKGLPHEQWTLGVTTGGEFLDLKGLIEALLDALHISDQLAVEDSQLGLMDSERQCQLKLGDQILGFIGQMAPKGLKQFGLRSPATVAEVNLDVLCSAANLIPQHIEHSEYPAISRDINLILPEEVRWLDLELTIRSAAGPLLENLRFQEIYRDPKKDGAATKRLLFSMDLRSSERTMTNEEADTIRDSVVTACDKQFGARLLA
jgi:phenylalanyl-tRNA synthetase beta chain